MPKEKEMLDEAIKYVKDMSSPRVISEGFEIDSNVAEKLDKFILQELTRIKNGDYVPKSMILEAVLFTLNKINPNLIIIDKSKLRSTAIRK